MSGDEVPVDGENYRKPPGSWLTVVSLLMQCLSFLSPVVFLGQQNFSPPFQ